ncbi:hypothetical protein DH2020_010512 [Rehmannia glutinosa]|uniref:Uncharacterized protein n=1 Tax=Rehmannia glutinosa TaxID=99300 RepID=A0ABR0XAT4_REHGL
MTLLNKVAKLGKRVQLLPNNEHYLNNNNNIHFNEKQNDTRSNQDRDNYNDPMARQNGKMERNWSSCHDSRHLPKRKEEKEEEHRCEPYEPPKVDERACRDFYCKVHPRGMHKIVDKVPADGSSSLFGGLPFYGNFGPYSTGSYLSPGWYGEEPPLPTPQFGYRRPPPRMLPHPFGFQ